MANKKNPFAGKVKQGNKKKPPGGRRGACGEDEPRARQNGRRRHQSCAVIETAVSNPSFGADFFVFSGQAISRRCFAWKERLGGSV